MAARRNQKVLRQDDSPKKRCNSFLGTNAMRRSLMTAGFAFKGGAISMVAAPRLLTASVAEKTFYSLFRLATFGLIWMAYVLTIASAQANVEQSMIDDGSTIIISNEIATGDNDKFRQIAAALRRPAVVVLNSHGGALVEGLMIGETIRAKGYSTVVLNGSICASTCSLIWLAGKTRYAGETANVGFHAAYVGGGDSKRESGSGNALVGAYLSRLNLSYSAIMFATSAAPNEIAWLRAADAARVGISYVTLPGEPEPARQAAAAQADPAGSSLEQRIQRLVVQYYAVWSGSGTDVNGLTQFYNDSVSFYGSNVSLAQLIAEKQKSSVRWPTRHYTIKANTVFVRCADTCAVSGVVEWDVSSAERGVRSAGAANFVLKIVPVQSPIGGIIVSENGSVLSNRIDPLTAESPASVPVGSVQLTAATPAAVAPDHLVVVSAGQQIASTTPRYAEGRQARIVYEQWFAALSNGLYKAGATFWASHRSIQPLPACTHADETADWQAGCAASKAFFVTVDLRRKTEKDYWWGWNSL